MSDSAAAEQPGVNWSGNHRYAATALHRPSTLEELQDLVARSPRIRALGSRHSFTDLADTSGILVSLDRLPRRVDIDAASHTARVAAGMTYGEVAARLHEQGWALANMASLPHISVAGAVATGTHGSGDALPSLSAAVRRVEMVGADGSLKVLAEEDPQFAGGVVALGALGVVTTLDLEVEPTYEVAQTVYLDVPWDRVDDRIDALRAGAYSVSVFTDWQGDVVPQVWVKSRDAGAAPLEGWLPADRAVHMIRDAAVEAVTAQQGVPGPWHERLPHFRADHTPSRGQELQSEYFVPRDRAAEAFHALRALGDRLAPVLLISEIRTVAGDSMWLSGAFERETVGLHFTWVLDPPGVLEALGRVEDALLPLNARPHWGKVFRVGVDELRPMYPKFDDFLDLRASLDPNGTFTNAFLERCLGVG